MLRLVLLAAFLAPTSQLLAQFAPPVRLEAGAILTLPAGANPRAVAVGDFNQDLVPDIAVCQTGLNSVAIYPQTRTGAFPGALRTYDAGEAPTGLVAMALVVRPGGPLMDLIALSGPSSRWTMLRNTEDGQANFTVSTTSYGTSLINPAPQLTAAYIDRDQWRDIAYTSNVGWQTGVAWASYSGFLTMRNGSSIDLRYGPSSLALEDFDRDSYLDVVATNTAANRFTVVLANASSRTADWGPGNTIIDLPSGGVAPVSVAASDVNGDSFPDIALAHAGSQDITVFLSNRARDWVARTVYPLPAPPRQVLLADLNDDSHPDLLVLTAANELLIYQHKTVLGGGRYAATPQVVLATGAAPVTMHLADVNGDRRQDVVVACAGDNTVHVYLNRSVATVTAVRSPQAMGVQVYPNPATHQLTLTQPAGRVEPLQAQLVDGLGRCVREQPVATPQATLSTTDLPRGVYVLRLRDAQGVSTQRVVLQ